MKNKPDILEKILQHKQQELVEKKQHLSLEQIKQQCLTLPTTRNFIAAIQAKLNERQPAVIAEIKKASPSKGVIRENFASDEIAKSYAKAGAVCLSVLTDAEFFQGSDEYLQQAKAACTLPVLRKDFIIDEYQIYESRIIGADCILLIVAALTQTQLANYYELAKSLGMDVLIEIHDATELQQALTLKPSLIGINNRDLHTFTTTLETSVTLSKQIPDEIIIVSESGIHTKEDVQLLREHNINTFLIGEAFMRVADPGEELRKMLSLRA